MKLPEEISWKKAASIWKKGGTVWSAELGGLGPAYEQCIQILLWEILARWKGPTLKPNEKAPGYPEIYDDHVEKVVRSLNKLGFSGSQVGVAKATAYQFMVYGYSEMMSKLPDERWIQVDKNFPRFP